MQKKTTHIQAYFQAAENKTKTKTKQNSREVGQEKGKHISCRESNTRITSILPQKPCKQKEWVKKSTCWKGEKKNKLEEYTLMYPVKFYCESKRNKDLSRQRKSREFFFAIRHTCLAGNIKRSSSETRKWYNSETQIYMKKEDYWEKNKEV